MTSKTTSAIPNWKKKKWYDLVAPPIFAEKVVGETMCESPEALLNRTVEVNLMNLTENPKKQSFNMKLRVVEVRDNKGLTKPIQIEMLPAYTRRLIKGGRDRIDLSFKATSKDGVVLRVKPLIIPKSRINRSLCAGMQLACINFMTKFVIENNYETVFSEVSRSTIQKDLKRAVDKVFPTKMVEIRMIEVELVNGVRSIKSESAVASDVKVEVAPVAEAVVEEKPKHKKAESKEESEE
jgi:small subunit ribosomal protein S3Ae